MASDTAENDSNALFYYARLAIFPSLVGPGIELYVPSKARQGEFEMVFKADSYTELLKVLQAFDRELNEIILEVAAKV